MPIPTLTTLSPSPDFTEVQQKLNKTIQELNNLLLNLDSLNVVSITANSTTITSDLAGGAYIQLDGDGLVVNNGAYNTFTVDINGNVVMTSATIQSQSGYPKVVMDPSNDLFGAYFNATNYIAIEADYGGAPSLNFFSGGTIQARLDMLLGFEIVNVSTVNKMIIDGGTKGTDMSGSFFFDNWSEIISIANGTLEDALDGKASTGVSTGLSGGHNHGIPNGTVLMVSGGGTVTFTTAANHSHSQT